MLTHFSRVQSVPKRVAGPRSGKGAKEVGFRQAAKKDLRKRWRRQKKQIVKVQHLKAIDLTTLEDYQVVCSYARFLEISPTVIKLELDRADLCHSLKGNLHLDPLVGQRILWHVPQMVLDMEGLVVQAWHKGQGVFHILIEFAHNTPDYWGECLVDLLKD